jgi:hypothetical protein
MSPPSYPSVGCFPAEPAAVSPGKIIVPRIVVGGVIFSWLRRLVESWVDRILGASFRSIISLLEEAQLDRHFVRGGPDLHPGGLLGDYRHRGLEVASIPCTDYQRPSDDNMREALATFRRLPQPVLLHCSGGIDRSSPVAAYLSEHDAR